MESIPASGPVNDVEKAENDSRFPTEGGLTFISTSEAANLSFYSPIKLQYYAAKLEQLAGVEARGIERVLPQDRDKPSTMGYLLMVSLWFSSNIVASNIAVGMLGPAVWGLSFLDSCLLATFGGFLGAMGTAYTSTFGPISGNRTLVCARYTMGWWAAKLCVLLNIIIMIGYGVVSCVLGGQILSAVANNNMSVIVGIIIVPLITWIIATFGLGVFQGYEKYAWLPQLMVYFVMVGCAGPKFDTTTKSTGDPATLAGNRLSFLSLCIAAPITWAGSGGDFYVYYPEETNPWLTALMTELGLGISTVFSYLLGVGLTSGVAKNPTWSAANAISPGALMVEIFQPLGGFGKLCGVVLCLGLIGNGIPGTYAAAVEVQILGRQFYRIPRFVWTTVISGIYTVCALAGRNQLYTVFLNWLAPMGYWVCIYIAITIEEQVIFRRTTGYNWATWNDASKLPLGLAGFTAFCAGWGGAAISMNQVYFTGPIAKMVGDEGADLGIYVGMGFAALVFPPLRWLELRIFGR